MTVQEIFNSTAVRSIELQILSLYHETERHYWHDGENKKAIISLLEVRKRILNSMFVLNEQNKLLLAEFNEAMKKQLIEMRKRAIGLYNKVCHPDMDGRIVVEGKCFMGYEYSKIHPVQSMRAKKMWAILNATLDDYIFIYSEHGVCQFHMCSDDPEFDSENEFLYLDEELDNWNEGLDREMSADMLLTYAFHNLFQHMDFSIFDLLWIRDFNIELHLEHDYQTYADNECVDDLDWKKCDYFD